MSLNPLRSAWRQSLMYAPPSTRSSVVSRTAVAQPRLSSHLPIRRSLSTTTMAPTRAPCKRISAPILRSFSTRAPAQAQYKRFGSATRGQTTGNALSLLGARFAGGKGSPNGRAAGPIVVIILGGGGAYYVYHLERAPTGRLRFLDVTPTQERAMGEQAYAETMHQYRGKILSPSHPESKRVQRIAQRLIAALDEAKTQDVHQGGALEQAKWEVHVINSDEKNAFVLPGGKIFCFSGILETAANDDGLATVLGHEIAHQTARHSAEKASGFKVLMALSFLLEGAGVDAGISRMALTFLLNLPNSRKLETEADYLGLRLMARACFNPQEATHLWERMQAAEGGSGGGIMDSAKALISTHPVNRQRIDKITKWLPEALALRQEKGCPAPRQVGAFAEAAGLADWKPIAAFR